MSGPGDIMLDEESLPALGLEGPTVVNPIIGVDLRDKLVLNVGSAISE